MDGVLLARALGGRAGGRGGAPGAADQREVLAQVVRGRGVGDQLVGLGTGGRGREVRQDVAGQQELAALVVAQDQAVGRAAGQAAVQRQLDLQRAVLGRHLVDGGRGLKAGRLRPLVLLRGPRTGRPVAVGEEAGERGHHSLGPGAASLAAGAGEDLAVAAAVLQQLQAAQRGREAEAAALCTVGGEGRGPHDEHRVAAELEDVAAVRVDHFEQPGEVLAGRPSVRGVGGKGKEGTHLM